MGHPQDNRQRLQKMADRVFHTPDGAELLKELDLVFASRRSFVQGDPYTTAFKEGQRDVILFLKQLSNGEIV